MPDRIAIALGKAQRARVPGFEREQLALRSGKLLVRHEKREPEQAFIAPRRELQRDVLLGEPSLFPVNAEVERSWQILDPVLERWAESGEPEPYPAGSWGPDGANALMARTGRVWRRP